MLKYKSGFVLQLITSQLEGFIISLFKDKQKANSSIELCPFKLVELLRHFQCGKKRKKENENDKGTVEKIYRQRFNTKE